MTVGLPAPARQLQRRGLETLALLEHLSNSGVCLPVCMFLCIHICISTSTPKRYTHIHKCICRLHTVYVYTHIHTYLPTYIHTYIHKYIHTHINTYIHALHIHAHIQRHTHVHIHIYIYTYIHMYLYISIYIHVYICAFIHVSVRIYSISLSLSHLGPVRAAAASPGSCSGVRLKGGSTNLGCCEET